jgi:hypothetical protein
VPVRVQCLDDATRRIHHGLDLGHFVFHGLARTVSGGSTVSGFLGGSFGLFLRFFGSSALLFFGSRVFRRAGAAAAARSSRCSGLGLLGFGGSSGGFSAWRLASASASSRRVAAPARQRLGLGGAFGFQLGQTLLLCLQFSLTASLFLLTFLRFGSRSRWTAAHALRSRPRGLVALDEGALLAHFHLDGARFAGCIGLLDLGGFLAGQRDFFFSPSGAARANGAGVPAAVLIFFRHGSDANFSTPAERSCVSSKSAGIFSSVANWATLLLAIQSSFLCARR